MIRKLSLLSLLLTCSMSAILLAQDTGSKAGATTSVTQGEVRKVDNDTKKITIRHGAIENLGMPPMTMVFQVKDPSMLKAVKEGDKVKFSVEKAGTALVVTNIEPDK